MIERTAAIQNGAGEDGGSADGVMWVVSAGYWVGCGGKTTVKKMLRTVGLRWPRAVYEGMDVIIEAALTLFSVKGAAEDIWVTVCPALFEGTSVLLGLCLDIRHGSSFSILLVTLVCGLLALRMLAMLGAQCFFCLEAVAGLHGLGKGS